MNIDDQLHGISTIIDSVWSSGKCSASGFFYNKYEIPHAKSSQAPGWVRVEEQWLVTNRHVLINDHGKLADSITFYHRKITTEGLKWFPIKVSGTELHDRCKFHKSNEVDVAVIRVLDLLTDIVMPKPHQKGENIMSHGAVSASMFPGANKISVGVGDEALVIGYPRSYYDKFSKFPIVKSGIIASKWGMPFNGCPYFLIDAKLFPGSSGSLVISRPTNFIIKEEGMYLRSKGQKVFAFLGVFSGEPFTYSHPVETEDFTIISKKGYNVGIVWYYHLIPEIISNGKQHKA